MVLPDHLHCVIELPPDDADFALRWCLIKMDFSKAISLTERRNASRVKRGIWQRRYREHRIRDEADFRAHIDYVHINPVKHGLVKRGADWPHSTFHRLVQAGVYPADWAGCYEDNARHLAEWGPVQSAIPSVVMPSGYCIRVQACPRSI